jgi:1,4-alpha-glucan branching enzyme
MADVTDATTALTDQDLYLFNEGSHVRLYDKLGAHLGEDDDGRPGVRFAVWAPAAREVSVVGDFNGWERGATPLDVRGSSGIWEGFVAGLEPGARYKYHVVSSHGVYAADKADPFGFRHETPPATASVVWDLDYDWSDGDWMARRSERNAREAPISVYEVHPGSWRRPDEPSREFLTWRELADALAAYCVDMGFTHVELLPVMEHPFYGSWGYQTTGYFAPTSRYGSPQDFMYLVDTLHRAGIGVILDWVPSHFPTDEHGLGFFDGTHLFEHADPRLGFHPDWGSFIFNYGRHEVRSFLLSSALFWLDRYHIDGIRVDAVASMLYRDYSRRAGEWIPNEYGGRENLEAVSFLRRLNEEVYGAHPDVQMIAEESTAWPMVSRPTYAGGLGFGMKWDMGWMHDTLEYMKRDPVHRPWHHDQLTFRMVYAFNEAFMLPLSHDEVVHGKGSLLQRMPGDPWRQRANLRLLLGYMWAQPGKKLLFMGCELGQVREWAHDGALDWHLLDDAGHEGIRRWVRDLNRVMAERPALHVRDFDPRGFEWLEARDAHHSTLAFLRKAPPTADRARDEVLVLVNATPEPRENYRVGVPRPGRWQELLNSDAEVYGGSGMGNLGSVESAPVAYHGHFHSVNVTLPPLSVTLFGCEGTPPADVADDPDDGALQAARPPGSAPVGRDGGEGPAELDDVWQDADRP